MNEFNGIVFLFIYEKKRIQMKGKTKSLFFAFKLHLLDRICNGDLYCIDIWLFLWLLFRVSSSFLWINLLAFKNFFYSFFSVTFSYYYYLFMNLERDQKQPNTVTLFVFFNSFPRYHLAGSLRFQNEKKNIVNRSRISFVCIYSWIVCKSTNI